MALTFWDVTLNCCSVFECSSRGMCVRERRPHARPSVFLALNGGPRPTIRCDLRRLRGAWFDGFVWREVSRLLIEVDKLDSGLGIGRWIFAKRTCNRQMVPRSGFLPKAHHCPILEPGAYRRSTGYVQRAVGPNRGEGGRITTTGGSHRRLKAIPQPIGSKCDNRQPN